MNTPRNGFTIIELLFIIGVLGLASVLFFVQKHNFETANRDENRKTSINAMYYSLEEVYFKANNTYPRTLNAEVLPSVAPDLFKDPNGISIGDGSSEYRYEGTNCNGEGCANYVLRTTLENEADYIKENPKN